MLCRGYGGGGGGYGRDRYDRGGYERSVACQMHVWLLGLCVDVLGRCHAVRQQCPASYLTNFALPGTTGVVAQDMGAAMVATDTVSQAILTILCQS